MNKTKRISFKCTDAEYIKILESKNKTNYKTLSDYCREVSKHGKINNYIYESRKSTFDKIDELTNFFKSLKKDIKDYNLKELENKFKEVEDIQNQLIESLYLENGNWKVGD